MFNKLFRRKSLSPSDEDEGLDIPVSVIFREEGIVTPSFLQSDLITMQGHPRALAAYLMQLEEEGHLTPLVEDWLLPWEKLYTLLGDEEHQLSLTLFELPSAITLTPVLSSEGSLSDLSFKVIIRGWINGHGELVSTALQRQGAVCTVNAMPYLMRAEAWYLLQAVRELGRSQRENPGECTNQLGWANVRKAGKVAGAVFDGFLDKTVVIKPESLRLRLNKSEQRDLNVMEVTPQFDDQPDGWIETFDALKTVPDRYAIPSNHGGITHVLISPEVKTVLQEIRSLPGRRVAGDKALQFLRNPYSCLGEDANRVLNQTQFEEDRDDAGFFFLRFSLHTRLNEQDRIESIDLHLDTLLVDASEPVRLEFRRSTEFAQFVHELEAKLASGLPCGFWKGFQLELADFDQAQLDGVEALLSRWISEEAGGLFDAVLDLSQYGNRVIGIGVAKTLSSPYLTRESGQQWLPEELLSSMGLDGELLAKWDTDNPALLEQLKQNIAEANATNQLTVLVPGLEATLPIPTAEAIAVAWAYKLRLPKEAKGSSEKKTARSVLLIEDNIEELSYVESRASALQLASSANPVIPKSLLQHIDVRDHQKKGVAWLQHLFECSPVHASGCLLADDMGLGKTLQLLMFIAWYLEQPDNQEPVLIVAPVSLLDNWENEMTRFFAPGFATVLKLYGSALAAVKFQKNQLPAEIKERGIYNLLKPNWRQDKQIVLTTYETLRDQEFSLARQRWAIVVCDEAQKIKNPAALVTSAARALPARFKIACTGTPVENSLTDLWCLFDFVQPGFLGTLNEFGRKYRQPVEARNDQDLKSLDELRALIEPQILRRLKSEVAKDLPAKIEATDCMLLPMSAIQFRLYQSEITRYREKGELLKQTGVSQNTTILGLLHTMKMICAHPHAIRPEGELLHASPKMRWLMGALEKIKISDEKVIIFTELRDIQRALQLTILDHFQLNVTVINGDTNASSEKGPSRQRLIDSFQEKAGFGVIILSTTAVGFGVNVQAANHVIHFTRCWNPAKEDQATDRAYRIGQKKDVVVYYPTIAGNGFESFEQKLDSLLVRKRSLASDMLNGSGDINLLELASD